MAARLKVCPDCGVRKFIGRTKKRCKSCRRKGPMTGEPITKSIFRIIPKEQYDYDNIPPWKEVGDNDS